MSKTRISNFLNAIAPLAEAKIDFEDVLIIAYLDIKWSQKSELKVNNVIQGIKNLSPSTIHRRLKKMKQSDVLCYVNSKVDERVKFIQKGKNYNKYLVEIEKLYDFTQFQKYKLHLFITSVYFALYVLNNNFFQSLPIKNTFTSFIYLRVEIFLQLFIRKMHGLVFS